MEKLFTIGIAVHNGEEFLPSCLRSVTAQKGDDIEIIVVDDGSTDSTGEICDSFAAKDSRMQIVHNSPNGGVSVARNIIIDMAKGKWMCFVDGDDMLRENALEMARNYADEQYDVVYFDISYFRFDTAIPSYTVKREPMAVHGDEIKKLRLSTIHITQTEKEKYVNRAIYPIFAKIYRIDFIRKNKLYFTPGLRNAEDQFFSFQCLYYVKNANFVRQPMVLYRNNDTSLMRGYSKHIIEYNHHVLDLFRKEILERDLDTDECMRRYYCLELMTLHADLLTDIFHRYNNKPREEKEKEFNELFNSDHYKEALEKCTDEFLTEKESEFLKLARTKDYDKISAFFRKYYRIDAVKVFMNRIKISGPLKRLMKKN